METTIIKEIDRIPLYLKIGNKYHCNWAGTGCVWVLKGIGSDGLVSLETPKSKKQLETTASSLRLLNRDALNAAKKRLNLK